MAAKTSRIFNLGISGAKLPSSDENVGRLLALPTNIENPLLANIRLGLKVPLETNALAYCSVVLVAGVNLKVFKIHTWFSCLPMIK